MKIMPLLILTMLFLQTGIGQTTYYASPEGIILPQEQYDQLKAKIVSDFKAKGTDVNIIESFTNVAKRRDSIIKTYAFRITTTNPPDYARNAPNFGAHLVGKKLPEATLNTLDGSTLNLSQLNGKPTMVNFWFTTCRPCINEFPALNELKAKYEDSVNFVSITFDNAQKAEKLMQRFPFEFLALVDANTYISQLGIEAFPTSLFIDKDGIVQKTEGSIPFIFMDGERKGDTRDFKRILDSLL